MLLIVGKILYSILLTLCIIACAVFILWYVMAVFSIVTGLFGWYNVSMWFRRRMTGIQNRSRKIFNILLRRK